MFIKNINLNNLKFELSVRLPEMFFFKIVNAYL